LVLTWIFLIPLLTYAAEKSLEARRTELNRLLADEWEYTLRTQPELATHIGDNRYNDRLSDLSDKAIADDLEHERQALRLFEAIDTTGFPEQEKLNCSLMVRSLRDGIEAARFKDWEMPATQFGGIHLGYASFLHSPFRT
jgi:uncharacterized protein (DUF885 family)